MIDNPYEEAMQETIVSYSNGHSGTNLIVMSDSKKGLKDEDQLPCQDKGLFQCDQICYHFMDICDQKCQCSDCQDELGEILSEETFN